MATAGAGSGRQDLRPVRPRPKGRSLLAFLALALSLIGPALLTVAFLWPSAVRQVDLGHIDRFEPGSVTSFRIVDGRVVLMGEAPRQQVQPRHGVHLVRLDEGELRAFSWSCTRLGWAVSWLPGPGDGPMRWPDEGVFRSAVCGSTWSMDGRVVYGPAPRGLDRFAVTVTAQGRVMIDLSQVIEGERAAQRQQSGGPPSVTPTPSVPPLGQ